MTIGQRIKSLRLKHQLTQEDIAKKIGVAIQTIYKYENEIVTNIPSDKIELIAKALQTTPAYLMGWEDDDKPNIKSINNNMNLSEQEKKLIEYYRELNDDGKKYIMQSTIVATKLYPEYPESQIAALGGGVKKVKPNASKERLQEIYNELKKK